MLSSAFDHAECGATDWSNAKLLSGVAARAQAHASCADGYGLSAVLLTPVGPHRAQADLLAGRTPQTQTRPDAKPVSPSRGSIARMVGGAADVYDPMVTFLAAECPGVKMFKTQVASRSRRDVDRPPRVSRPYIACISVVSRRWTASTFLARSSRCPTFQRRACAGLTSTEPTSVGGEPRYTPRYAWRCALTPRGSF